MNNEPLARARHVPSATAYETPYAILLDLCRATPREEGTAQILSWKHQITREPLVESLRHHMRFANYDGYLQYRH